MDQPSSNTQHTDEAKVLYLYTGNHGKQTGVKDYINLISSLLKERGIDVRMSSALVPNATNLVVDEFTNYVENRKIALFKEGSPESRLVFVLTEFVERRWGVESFNFFSGLRAAASISVFNVYLRLVRDDFEPISPRVLLTVILFLPVLLIHEFVEILKFLTMRLLGKGKDSLNPVTQFLQKHHQQFYFHMRYLGLRTCLPYADAVITSHEQISLDFWKGGTNDGVSIKKLGVIYPEIGEENVLDKLMVNKKLFIEITGSITKHRQMFIQRINKRLTVLGLHHVFGYCLAIPFSLPKKPTKRGAYSLHPPQTKKWPYCSPMRIFRALTVDYNLPILTKNFRQNPIEDVCFFMEGNRSIMTLYEMYKDRNLLRDFMGPRISKYNRIAKGRNDKLVAQLITLDGKGEPGGEHHQGSG